MKKRTGQKIWVQNLLLMSLMLCIAAGVALAGDNTGEWTEEQVERYCYAQAKGNASAFDDCLSLQAFKVGQPKQPGEPLTLNKIDEEFNKKANPKNK